MKYVIIIENEAKILAQIAEALYLSDASLILQNFNNYEGFANWLKLFQDQGSTALRKAGYTLEEALDSPALQRQVEEARKKNEMNSIKVVGTEMSEHLLLVIAKLEMLQREHIQKLNDLIPTLKNQKACTDEATTSIVLTAFESPTFKAKDYILSNFGNILFKPFDKAILNQQLFFLLNGQQPAKSEFVFQQQTKAKVEMIKEGELEGFSEVGLVTLNDKPLDPGTVSKLYVKCVETEKLKSVSTVCVFSERSKTDPSQFLCYLKYFALKNEQILSVRKSVKENQVTKLKSFKKTPIIDKLGRFFHVAIICLDDSYLSIEETLDRNFKMLKTTRFKDTLEFSKQMKAEPFALDSVIFINSFFVDNPEKQIANFRDVVSKTNPLYEGARAHLFPVFVISNFLYPKNTEIEYANFVTNILYQPIDRAYFLKQFYLELNFLAFKEMPIELQYIPVQGTMKIGNTVETIDISEAAIHFNYSRSLSLRAFRKFILTAENESDIMEILAKCHFIKENKEKSTVEHQFNFFALNDSVLKSIRLWIRSTYINAKDGKGS